VDESNSNEKIEDQERRISKKGIILGLIVLVFNGSQSVVSNLRPSELNTLSYTFAVILFEFLIFLILYVLECIFRKRIKSQNISKDNNNCAYSTDKEQQRTELSKTNIIIRLLLIGLIFSFATYFVFLGYQSVDNVTGSIAVKTQPISMLIIGAIFLKEKVTLKESLSAGIMLLSVYYISTAGTMKMGEITPGIIYLLIAPTLWNIGHAITKRLFTDEILTVEQLILIRLGLSGLFTYLLFIILYDSETIWSFNSPKYLPSIYGMVFVYVMLHSFWYRTIKEIDVSLATSIIIPGPVVTVLLTYFFIKQPLYSYHFIGLIGTLIGLYGLLFMKNRKKNS
jgi:drug/metabolite transporter (DMT)-like permease